MADLRFDRRVGDARLAGVDFPWVEIEDRRMPLRVHPRDCPARETIGQHPHKAAAARRQSAPGEARGRDRPFDEVAARHRAPRMARTLRPAIMVVDDRRDAAGISIRSEEHTSELQSLMRISYAVF